MASKLGTIYTDFTANTVGFERGANRVRSQANTLGGDLNKLAGLASRVFVGFSVAVVAKEMIQAGEQAKKYAGQLSLVAGSSVGVSKAQDDLLASAQRTRTYMGDNVDLYSKLARSTEDLGISHQRLIGVTETLNKAGVVSAATTQEQSNALRQLSQGLAAGALRGDELNSVMENTPRIARAIADGMGITIGQLRQFGSEGKLTSEVIIKAIENQAAVIDKEFKKMPVTIDQATVQLKNSLESLLAPMGGVNGMFVQIIQATTTTVEGFKIMGDYISRYLAPVFKIWGDYLSIVSNALLQIPSALMLDFDTFNKLAAENEFRMNRIAESIRNYGKAIDETKPKIVDWGKTIFGDDKKIEPPKMPDIVPFKFDQDMVGQVEEYYAHLHELANQEQLTEQSLYTDRLKANQEYQNERLRQIQEARWQSVRTAREESEEKIKIARQEAQQRLMVANNVLFLLAQAAEASGKRAFKFAKYLQAANALINAYAAATGAAAGTQGDVYTRIGAYAATLGYVLQAYNAIKSVNIGGGISSGGIGGSVSIPSTTTPTQSESTTSTGTDKATFIIFTGGGVGSIQIDESNISDIMEMMRQEANNNNKRTFDADSGQMQAIIQAVKAS